MVTNYSIIIIIHHRDQNGHGHIMLSAFVDNNTLLRLVVSIHLNYCVLKLITNVICKNTKISTNYSKQENYYLI